MGKLSEEEKQQWKELFAYIEKEIFGYDENQKLQKNAVLRLRGLSQGKVVANNKIEANGNYGPDILLIAFKVNKMKILSAIKGKDFESEERKMAYICAIVRSNISLISQRVQENIKNRDKAEHIDTTIVEHGSAKYKKQSTRTSKKFEDLW